MPSAPASTPTCSVVVCTRNRPGALGRCLAAIKSGTYPRVDIVVVDNAPADEQARHVAARWSARYIVEPSPGLSRARNTGARSSRSDLVAFTDDDAVPDPGWVAALVEEFRDAGVAVVTGRTLPLSTGPEQAALGAFTSDLGPEPLRLRREDPFWFGKAAFGGIGQGGNMAFRRSAFDGWRGFDERLGRGAHVSAAEEHLAFAEMIAGGQEAAYTPYAIVRHPVAGTLDELRAEHLAAAVNVTAYAVFLILRTRFRRQAIAYVVERISGARRSWRFQANSVPRGLVPRWQLWLAYGRGVWRAASWAGPLRRWRSA